MKKTFKISIISCLLATIFSPEVIDASRNNIDNPVLAFVATDRLINAIEKEDFYSIEAELASQYAQGQSVIKTMLQKRDHTTSLAWVINNLHNQHGQTLAEQAQTDGDDLVEEMFTTKTKAHVEKLDHVLMTPLHCAITKQEVTNHLKKNANINAQDFNGNTPLHHAIMHNDYNIAKHLIDCGADVNIQNNEGGTPFYIATRYNHYSLIELLQHNNADINKPNINGNNPFASALFHGHTDAVRFISKCKNFQQPSTADKSMYVNELLKSKNKDGIYSLFRYLNDAEKNMLVRGIIKNELLDDLQLLLDSRAINVNCFDDNSGNNLLVYAPSVAAAKFLIKNEININQCNKKGNTPLHCITNTGILQCLLHTGVAQTQLKNKNGRTPLEQSITNNDVNKTGLFHSYGMHVDYDAIYLYLLAKNPRIKDLFKDAALAQATINIWWNNGTIDIDLDNEYKLEDFKPTQE